MPRHERLPDGTFMHQLYPARAKRLIEGCRGGLFDSQNANREGIDVTTLRSWVERGLDEEAEEPFRSFAEGYIRASIDLEQTVINRILCAADDQDLVEHSTELTERDSAGESGEAGQYLFRKTKTSRQRDRGDWRAAAWFAERRWPLRWGITRQPEGGPKEALRLPDTAVNRVRMLRERLVPPPPELVKIYRDAGYELVRAEQSAADPKPQT